MCLHTLEGLTGLSMAKVTTRHICAEFINDNLPWFTIYGLLDLFSHSSHIAVTLSPQHSDTRQYSGAIISKLTILPPNIRRKYSQCHCVCWIHFMNATTSLICHVKCRGADWSLSASGGLLSGQRIWKGCRDCVLCTLMLYLEGSSPLRLVTGKLDEFHWAEA